MKVKLANGALGVAPLAWLAILMTVVVPVCAADAAWAILVLSTAVVGAVRLTTLTGGVMVAVPVLALIVVTAGLDTLAAFAVTLLLATVAATAVLAAAACALLATCATVFVVFVAVVVLFVPAAAGVLGACAANSSSLVLVVAVLVVVVLLVVDEPLELTRPATTIAPPVTLIDPVEPPVVETAPLTVTAWAVAVI